MLVTIFNEDAPSPEETELEERAISLNNQGLRQSAEWRYEDALASHLEAVALVRKLAEARPETFLLTLAVNLQNLGYTQRRLGRGEDALASTRETVEICRRLAGARTHEASRNLASCLNTLGMVQKMMGQREDAFASLQEGLDVLWPQYLERRTKPDRAGQGDASAPRREDEGVRMHVESEQRRRATRIRRPATGGSVRRSL